MKVSQSYIPTMPSLPSFVSGMSRKSTVTAVIIVATAVFAVIAVITHYVKSRISKSAPSTPPSSTSGTTPDANLLGKLSRLSDEELDELTPPFLAGGNPARTQSSSTSPLNRGEVDGGAAAPLVETALPAPAPAEASAGGSEEADQAPSLSVLPSGIPIPENHRTINIRVMGMGKPLAIHFNPVWTIAEAIPEIQKQIFQEFGRNATGSVYKGELESFDAIAVADGENSFLNYLVRWTPEAGEFTVILSPNTEAV